MSSGSASSSQSRSIEGLAPGVLDATQPGRLLRHPSSRLFFATFHPRTATANQTSPNVKNLTLNEELCRPKRVVIETNPAGESSWRFVPKARWEAGVQDEGEWPRVVDLCGERVHITQDQWDIYKLDPAYSCVVSLSPKLSSILVAGGTGASVPVDSPATSRIPSAPSVSQGKRRLSTPPPDRQTRQHATPSAKKMRSDAIILSDGESDGSFSDSDDEVESMVIDPPRHSKPRSTSSAPTSRAHRFRQQMEENRKMRREKVARAEAKRLIPNGLGSITMEDAFVEPPSTPTNKPTSAIPPSTGKRKVSEPFLTDDPFTAQPKDNNQPSHVPSKRFRTMSPNTVKRELAAKSNERERKKQEESAQRLKEWREHRHNLFMKDILGDVPEDVPAAPSSTQATDGSAYSQSQPEVVTDDDGAARRATIEESRRKLAELERDRPLWEASAKKRAQSEQAESATAARAKADAARRAQEAEAARAAREALERERAAREAERRRAEQERAEAEQRAAERTRRQQQQRERWAHGPWTAQRALERYRALSDPFDAARFGADQPLAFELVPWPVLCSPLHLTVEDIDWAAVEAFFAAVRPSMRPQDFRVFVEKSHRRFHPDRWRSRGLLKSIEDEEERSSLEVAANTVAQAVTPLWRDVKSR